MKKFFVFVFLFWSAAAFAEPQRLTILHFGDLHGHVEQAARIAKEINAITAENTKKGWVTLVLNGGDLISGTPVSAKFGGKAEVEFLNAIKTDAMALGNHDFDFSHDVLKKFDPKFPVLAANVVFQDTGRLFTEPLMILIPNKSLKIGIIGIAHPQTPQLTTPQNIANLKFEKSVPVVKKAMKDLVKITNVQIALTHEGVKNDVELAKAVKDLDAVVGGHDHVRPEEYCNIVAKRPVCQTPSYGTFLGRIDLEVDGSNVKEAGYKLIAIDNKTKEDPKVAGLMRPYLDSVGTEMKQVIGVASKNFNHGRSDGTTELGRLITSVMKEHMKADFAIINTGGIRKPLNKGNVTKGTIEEILPFPNTVVTINMTGKQINTLFKEAKSRGKVLQVSGPEKVDPKKTYSVATIDFFTNGGEGYTSFKNAIVTANSGKYVKDVLTDYIKGKKKL